MLLKLSIYNVTYSVNHSVSALLSPLIFLSDLGLFFRREVINDSESLSDFLWCFSLVKKKRYP